MQTSPDIRPSDWAMVATLGLVWGATFMVIEIALEGITPFWLAAGRIGFAAALTGAIWAMRGGRLYTGAGRAGPSILAIGALSSAVPFMLLSWGQQHVTSGFAGVSMAAVALMVLPLAHFFVPGDRMNARRVAGFVIGFLGVVVLIGGQAFESTGAAREAGGRLACLAAAACYAAGSILTRRLPPVDPVALAAVLLLVGTAVVVPVAWAAEGPPPLPDTRTLAALAVLGLLPTAGANFLRILVIRSAGPTFMTLTNYQVPVWSVIFGAVVLGEPLPPALLAALAMILSGVALSQWPALRRLSR
ncbi:drug/metabolite transporter (DMT)-like permease [Rhodovulum bhavnagarense]|uniref:Drug/metabolite transporter (DMT)-like permease n=1 Tax=Rhodovulum bhavnagarense TaxID=992286 RepID=A0A4R2RDV7_9RHOB|nr:DMT family transporter [Rhodovulum bhavnagarense]TCP60704.1 drug/metabolite transporter (DMT)-like permease [Rhodovulum bhavnagarense]